MAVYDQSYEAWKGAYGPRFIRAWAIARPGILQPFTRFWTLAVVLFIFAIVIGWLLILFALASSAMPDLFAMGNLIYRQRFLSNDLFYSVLVILSATVGAPLISRDIRHNALLMYFSRAIGRGDYIAGKFLSLSLFLLFVTLGPGLVLFFGMMGIGTDGLTTGQRLTDLGSLALHCLIIVIPMTSVVLACSSLTSRPYLASILWAGLYFSSLGISELMVHATEESIYELVSWNHLTTTLGEAVWQKRQVAAGMLDLKIEPTPGGALTPLLILGAITLVSLVVVRLRLRVPEGGE